MRPAAAGARHAMMSAQLHTGRLNPRGRVPGSSVAGAPKEQVPPLNLSGPRYRAGEAHLKSGPPFPVAPPKVQAMPRVVMANLSGSDDRWGGPSSPVMPLETTVR